MLASSRKPCDAANPKRRAKSPALHCGREREITRKRQPPARPVGGPMKSSAPTQALRADGGMRRPAAPGSAACLPCIVGRAFTPAGGLAAARKGIGKARRRTPQSADADSSPYRGAFRVAVPPKPPLQGEVDAPQGADGGVHCRLAAEISCKARQDLAQHPQGTVLASSRKPCDAARPQAAGVNARPTIQGKRESEPGTAGIGPGKHRASPCQNAPGAPPVLRRRALLRYPKSAYLSKVSVSNIVALPGKCKPRRQAVRRGKFCCPYRCPAGRIRVQ